MSAFSPVSCYEKAVPDYYPAVPPSVSSVTWPSAVPSAYELSPWYSWGLHSKLNCHGAPAPAAVTPLDYASFWPTVPSLGSCGFFLPSGSSLARSYEKPAQSYIGLIAEAILSSPEKKLVAKRHLQLHPDTVPLLQDERKRMEKQHSSQPVPERLLHQGRSQSEWQGTFLDYLSHVLRRFPARRLPQKKSWKSAKVGLKTSRAPPERFASLFRFLQWRGEAECTRATRNDTSEIRRTRTRWSENHQRRWLRYDRSVFARAWSSKKEKRLWCAEPTLTATLIDYRR